MLPTKTKDGMPDPTAETDLDDLVDRFEDAWQSGSPPSLDEYLTPARQRRPLLDVSGPAIPTPGTAARSARA